MRKITDGGDIYIQAIFSEGETVPKQIELCQMVSHSENVKRLKEHRK